MSYKTVADMADSYTLTRRSVAAAATEQIPDPDQWVAGKRWQLAASPGWADAWDSAVASSNPDPGSDPAVITDGMILSAVQTVNGG